MLTLHNILCNFPKRLQLHNLLYFEQDHDQGLRRMEGAYSEATIKSTQSDKTNTSNQEKDGVDDSDGTFCILLYIILNNFQWDKYLQKLAIWKMMR